MPKEPSPTPPPKVRRDPVSASRVPAEPAAKAAPSEPAAKAAPAAPVSTAAAVAEPLLPAPAPPSPPRPTPPVHPAIVEALGHEVLMVMKGTHFHILGQIFSPVFCGRVVEVTDQAVSLNPVLLTLLDGSVRKHPAPLSFPLAQIESFIPFECSSWDPADEVW